MSKRSAFPLFCLLAPLTILVASAAGVSAQVTTVAISGTVNDTAGAVIPNAQVTALATVGTDGTAGRNIIDGPGLKNVDLGIFRDFNFTERFKLQFRAEATNALNIVNLNNPVTGRNSSQFGQIRDARTMREVQLGLRLTF